MILRCGNNVRAIRFIYILGVLSTLTSITAKHIPKLVKAQTKLVVCTASVTPDPKEFQFDVEYSDLSLCTHLILMDNVWDKTITFWSSNDVEKERKYAKMTELRERYPNLKVSLALKYLLSAYIGVADTEEHRQAFIKKTADFILRHKFDGLDLVWDISDQRDDRRSLDRSTLINLVKELKANFKKYNLLLTSSVIAENAMFASIIDIVTMSKYINYLHFIPKYNYIETWPESFRIEDILKTRGMINLEKTIDRLINLGVSPSKMVIGMHFAGLSFHSLFDASMKYATFRKSLEYNRVCEFLLNNEIVQWESFYDEESGLAIARRESVPYGVFRPTDVIVYENSRSIANKILFILSRNLAGAMAFTIDMDDLHGDCGIEEDAFVDFIRGQHLKIPNGFNITQPLLKTINYAFRLATYEETQARISEKFKLFHASDRIDNVDIADDFTSKLPTEYRPLVPLFHTLNDAIVVAIDSYTGNRRNGRNEQVIQMPSLNYLVTKTPAVVLSLVYLVGKMLGY